MTSVSPLVTAEDGHTARSTVQFDAISAKIPAGDIKALIAKAKSYAEPGLRVALGGPPISAVVSPSQPRAALQCGNRDQPAALAANQLPW